MYLTDIDVYCNLKACSERQNSMSVLFRSFGSLCTRR